MKDNQNTVRFGENVVNNTKSVINDEINDTLAVFVHVFFKKVKEAIPELPDIIKKKMKEMAEKPETTDEILLEWSEELYKKGLVPQGYSGLPEELLIANFHQEGYLSGLYAGYALAMMSLVDHNADENLILSIRDDIRPNLVGHHYEKRDEWSKRYKSENYSWVESLKKPQDK